MNHQTFERTWCFQTPSGSTFLRVELPPLLGAATALFVRRGAGVRAGRGRCARARGFPPGTHRARAHRLKWGGGHVVRARPCRGPASKGGARRLRRCARTGASRSWSLAVRRAFHTPPFAAGSGALRARSVVLCGLFAWSAVGPCCVSFSPLVGGGGRQGARARVRAPGRAGLTSWSSPSNGVRLPAELKHITKRRKRN